MDRLDLLNTKQAQGQLLSNRDRYLASLLRTEDLDAFFSRHPTMPAMLHTEAEAESISPYLSLASSIHGYSAISGSSDDPHRH